MYAVMCTATLKINGYRRKYVGGIKMERKEMAVKLKHSGYNCAQAVIAAFCDITGMSMDESAALGAAFGMGMGCMKATCGAAVGAGIVLGKMKYGGGPVPPKARLLLTEFEKMCGATICGDLKEIGTGKVLCPCDDCVRNAVTILEKILEQ